MRSFTETIEIAAGPERVWRALSVPAEVICWDTGIIEPIDAPPDYPRPGQHVRWRYRLGPLALILHDRPTRVDPPSVLRSSIRLGPFDFDETYTLRAKGASATQLTADLSLSSTTPLLGSLLERTLGQPLARSTVRSSLAAIKRHCQRLQ
ncbi:MAG TPA: SRPBCC family protein [Thermoanaerobaculia bacterium]|nr:SRPBCC family protein [Thermoanaerobaculia bacterium]